MKIDFIESFAKEIEAKLYRIHFLVKKSNLKSGEYHEEVVRNALRNFLSRRYSVKTGYVYLDENTVSKQIDILVIDENNPFTYYFQEGDFVIVRPESVVAALEIKTRLRKEEFRDSFANIVSIKRVEHKALGYYGHIYAGILGFFSNKTLPNEKLGEWFQDKEIANYASEVSALWPNCFFFYDHGLFLHLDDDRNFDKSAKAPFYYKLFRNNQKPDVAWQLSLLITFIWASCENEDNSNRNLLAVAKAIKDFDFNEAMVGNDRFSPKTGHDKWK